MSTDKIQALQDAFAEIFSELHRDPTKAEQASFIIDHSALAGIFSEAPSSISTDTHPSIQFFNDQILAEIFSEPAPLPINPHAVSLNFDAGSSFPPLSLLDHSEPVTNGIAVAPSSNAANERLQAAKSSLAKLRGIFSSKVEPLAAEAEKEPSDPSASNRLNALEPRAEAIATTSSIHANSPYASSATSSLAKLRSLFLTDPKPSPSIIEKKSSASAIDVDLRTAASASTVAFPTNAEDAQPKQFKSLLAEPRPRPSAYTELSPTLEKETPRPTLADRAAMEPPIKTLEVSQRSLRLEPSSPTSTNIEPLPPLLGSETEPSHPILSKQQAELLLTDQLQEIPTDTKSLPIEAKNEDAQIIPHPELDNPQVTANFSPADAESVEARRAKSLLTQQRNPTEINTETPSAVQETETSLADQPNDVKETARDATTGLDSVERWQAKSFVETPLPVFDEESSRTTLSSQLGSMDSSENADFVASATASESAAMHQPGAEPSPNEVPSVHPNNTKPSILDFKDGSSLRSLSDRIDPAEPAAKIVTAAESEPSPTSIFGDLSNAARLGAVASWTQGAQSLAPSREIPSAAPTDTRPPPLLEQGPAHFRSGRINNDEPVAKASAVPPSDVQRTLQQSLQAENLHRDCKQTSRSFPLEEAHSRLGAAGLTSKAAAINLPPITGDALAGTQLAKSLLAELDLPTAIRLRWLMRDIRAEREAVTPASENDLAALVELDFIEIREKGPALTALGVLALE
jgi:hypothetical protein